MKHLSRIILAAIISAGSLWVLASAGPEWTAQDPEVQFQRAVQLETVDGNLNAAVELYRQVVNNNGNNRVVAAKALLRLGGCYEKLGLQEARKTYLQLVSDYPEQQQEVAAARERLAELSKIDVRGREPRFRKIQVPTKLPDRGSGKLSPDGQKLAFISDGSLWVVPVHGKTDPDIAGAPVRLTEPMDAWDLGNVSITWSVDGKWIGFRHPIRRGSMIDEQELYILPANGGRPERLPISWKDWAGDVDTLRYALSAEARTIYFAHGVKPEELRIYSMPARGGERRALTEPTTREPALSPDGSTIAYVKARPGKQVASTHQVWVRPVEGGDPVLICEVPDPRWIRSPVWSPDGGMIAFGVSEKGNNIKQIWVVPLADDARPVAPPSKFGIPRASYFEFAGWTQDNRIGILIPTPEEERLYSVPAQGGRATQLTTDFTAMPRWSPDGKRIYFAGDHVGEDRGLEYVPAEGGKVIRAASIFEHLGGVYPSQLAISPDGKTLCFAGRQLGRKDDRGPHLFTVPVEGGTPARLATNAAGGIQPSDVESEWCPEWSPDGTRIAFIRYEDVKPGLKGFNIFTMPRNGGEPRRISTHEDQVEQGNVAWSPDGEAIAFFGQDSTLRLIPAEGGRSRILVSEAKGMLPWRGIAWSPDGRRIAYSAGGGLWIMSHHVGKPEKIETGLDAGLLKIGWSPDGKSIAFTARKGGEPELWLMEDFLPLIKTSQK